MTHHRRVVTTYIAGHESTGMHFTLHRKAHQPHRPLHMTPDLHSICKNGDILMAVTYQDPGRHGSTTFKVHHQHLKATCTSQVQPFAAANTSHTGATMPQHTKRIHTPGATAGSAARRRSITAPEAPVQRAKHRGCSMSAKPAPPTTRPHHTHPKSAECAPRRPDAELH